MAELRRQPRQQRALLSPHDHMRSKVDWPPMGRLEICHRRPQPQPPAAAHLVRLGTRRTIAVALRANHGLPPRGWAGHSPRATCRLPSSLQGRHRSTPFTTVARSGSAPCRSAAPRVQASLCAPPTRRHSRQGGGSLARRSGASVERRTHTHQGRGAMIPAVPHSVRLGTTPPTRSASARRGRCPPWRVCPSRTACTTPATQAGTRRADRSQRQIVTP